MKKFSTAILFSLICSVISTLAQKNFCFENDGLKLKQTVSFTLTENKIEGIFKSSGYEENAPAELFDFTGTKAGNILTVKFDAGKLPYQVTAGTKRIIWTFGATTLRIPMYGKNYETNKYAPYTADFDKCKK